MKQWFYIVAVAVSTPTVLAGCGDPCKDLSNQICSCERTTTDRNACTTRVSLLISQYTANPNKAIEQAGRDQCSALLNDLPSDPQHACDALTRGYLQLYGLSKESATD